MKSLLHNSARSLAFLLFAAFVSLSCNRASRDQSTPEASNKPAQVATEPSSVEEVVSVVSSPRPLPKLAASHKDGDWEYEVTFEPDPHEYEPYGISISYKGEPIVGQTGDVISTPWGILKCDRRRKWIALKWGCFTPADFNGKRDLTPVAKDTIRPASHPTEEEILADCITILREHRKAEYRDAIAIIRHQGATAISAVPSLIDILTKEYDLSLVHGSPSLNTIFIIECLGFIGAGAREAMPAPLRYIEHHDVNIRSSLVGALFRIAPGSDDTKAYIVKSCNDTSKRVRAAAESAARELTKMENANKKIQRIK